ncbi:MAG: hypothetical protein AAFZ07_13600 [Actinomycetota bacterium]
MLGGLGACSESTSLGVINTCPFAVEVQNPPLRAGEWRALDVGERVGDLIGGDEVELLVRRGPDGPSMSMSVAETDIDDLAAGPFGPEVILTEPICGLLAG